MIPKATPVQQVNRKVEAVKRTMKSQESVGFHDLFNASNASTSASIYLLNGLQVGDTSSSRDADEVLIKSLKSRINIVGIDDTNVVRVMFVIDHEPKQATMSISDLLDTAVIPPPFAFRKMDYKKRFTVLHDRTFSTVLSTESEQQWIQFNQPLNLKTHYAAGANAGTSADITRNALYLVILSDSGVTAHPTFNAATRITYVR